MAKRSIESRSQELLARARELTATPGTTWVDANNAILAREDHSHACFRTSRPERLLPRRRKAGKSIG